MMEASLCPKPKRLTQELETIKDVEMHRQINCAFYDLCLDYACIFNYVSFSCIGCSYFVDETKLKKELFIQSNTIPTLDYLSYLVEIASFKSKKENNNGYQQRTQRTYKKYQLKTRPNFIKYKLKSFALCSGPK